MEGGWCAHDGLVVWRCKVGITILATFGAHFSFSSLWLYEHRATLVMKRTGWTGTNPKHDFEECASMRGKRAWDVVGMDDRNGQRYHASFQKHSLYQLFFSSLIRTARFPRSNSYYRSDSMIVKPLPQPAPSSPAASPWPPCP